MPKSPVLRVTVLCLCASLWLAEAMAQDRPRRRFQEAVSVLVDNDAAKTLLTIEDRWAAGRWQEALEDLITLCESRPGAIVQTDWGDYSGVSRYQPVTAAAERWLATLSTEGLARYRERIDPAAMRLWHSWERTADPAVLEQLVRRYFYSRPAEEALWELGHSAWRRGDLATARNWWSELLHGDIKLFNGFRGRYPDSSRPVADVAARIVLCDLLTSGPDTGNVLAEFGREFGTAQGSLGGQSGLWIDLLTRVAREAAGSSTAVDLEDVPTFAGRPDRGGMSARRLDLGGELWSIPLPNAVVPRNPMPMLHPIAPPLAYFPAVVDDVVYVNDGSRIFAWNLFSGTPVWDPRATGSALIYPSLAPDLPLAPRRPVRGSPLWTCTVGNGRLYASLGSVVTTTAPSELREQASELVCLDIAAGEGRLLWSLPSTEISARVVSDDPDAPPWMWEGTPLLAGTRLYGTLSRRRPQLEWSIVCLDAETGGLLWHRPVGMSRPTPPDHENLATHLLLAAGHGCIYLSTNWGAIAALEASNGDLRWSVSYESEPRADGWKRAGASAAPPCLVTPKYIYAAPADSGTPICLDAKSGALIWPKPDQLDLPQVDEPMEHLVGVRGRCLIASGASLWGLDAETGKLRWTLRPGDPELQGYGRGWIAGDAVYWPSQTAIQIVDPQTGAVLRDFPLQTPDLRRMGGHLIQAGGVLLIASHDRLTAYGEYARLWETFERRISLDADDSRSRCRLAELAMLRGDAEIAAEHWGVVSRQPDSIWRRRCTARWLVTALRPVGSRGTISRERFAQARGLPLHPAQWEQLLALEVEHATDVDWRIDALHRWVQLLARSPPDRDVRLSRSQAVNQLHQLRRKHGAATFARFDGAAKERLDRPGAVPEADALQLVSYDFPTTPIVTNTRAEVAVQPANHRNLAETTPLVDAVEYWTQAWRRPLPKSAEVLIPQNSSAESERGLLLVTTDKVEAWDRATGLTLWNLVAGSPPQWTALSNAGLLVATQAELLCVSPTDGRVRWRTPWHDRALNAAPQWFLGTDLLFRCHPESEISALDVETGDIRWRRDLSLCPWERAVRFSGSGIIGQQVNNAHVVVLPAQTGEGAVVFAATRRPWLRPPAVSAANDQIVLVDDQRAITAWSLAGDPRWGLESVITSAHEDPWVGAYQDRWYAVIDASRLIEIRANGLAGAEIPLSQIPIKDLSEALIDCDGVMVVATPTRLLGIDLEQLTPLWQVDGAFEGRQRIRATPGTREFLHAMSSTSSQQFLTVEIRDILNGRLRQTIRIPLTDKAHAEIDLDHRGLVAATSAEMTGYLRPQTARAAH